MTNSVSAARRLLAVTGFTLASVLSFVFTTIRDPMTAMLVLEPGELLQRFRDAPGVGGVHGHRRPVLGHGLRQR